jgi:hypothetical protein
VHAPRRIGRRRLLRRSVEITVRAPAGAEVAVVLDTPDLLKDAPLPGTARRSRAVAVARSRFKGLERARRPRLKLNPNARRRLRHTRRPLIFRVRVTAELPDGRRLSAVRLMRVTP